MGAGVLFFSSFSFSLRGRGQGQGPPFVRPQNSYDCGEVANGFGVVTIRFVKKNKNLLSCKVLQNTHTFMCMYVEN
jgi:hypothetical protein